jgi:uroporphyrinogen III methyltransferase / synthase
MNRVGKKTGIAYLVGAGPGDPELISLKAVKALKIADVVVYDYLASPRLLGHAPDTSQKIYVGKRAGHHSMKQEEINRLLVNLVAAGKRVVRLKGGDPFVFGRGGEECAALRKARLAFEVVPGISSGIAGPAYAGIPVTHRGAASSMAFITGHEDPTKETSSIKWEHLGGGVDTLVFFMGVGNLDRIAANLMANGRSPKTPIAVIERATTPMQRTVVATLETIATVAKKEKVSAPALTIVGDVVNLRKQFKWFETRPLFGRRIVVTRTREQASGLTDALTELGADIVEMPTIQIVPIIKPADTPEMIALARSSDWIVFTSPNGAQIFLDALLKRSGDIRTLGDAKIACIGPGTAQAVEKFSLKPAVVAADAVAEGLLKVLVSKGPWKGKQVLMPRAEQARDVLPAGLRNLGAKILVLPVYRTVPPDSIDVELLESISKGGFDAVTFSSSSTVENFFKLAGGRYSSKIKRNLRAVSIGPVTTKSLKKAGVMPACEAREHTIPGLVLAIRKYFKS